MASRFDVHPHHVLRAVLADTVAADVVRALGVDPDVVRLTLDERWLAAADTIEVEEIESLGVDAATLLAALNPRDAPPVDWGGRQLARPTRDVLVRSLSISASMGHRRVTSGHVLLALMGGKDPIVGQTFAAHGLRAKEARPYVARWGRRAT